MSAETLRQSRAKYAQYLLVTTLAIASNIGCLTGDFVFDDTEAIVNNKDTTVRPIADLFQNDFWGTNLSHKQSHKSYRPLTVLTYRLNYWILGRLEPWSFHLVNSGVHVLVCLLLWKAYIVVIGEDKSAVALWACLLFCVHPIHVEAVCGIVGRADLLAAAFFLLSFLSYAFGSAENRVKGGIGITLSIIFAALAMFSKEHGITVLGFNFIYEVLAVQKLNTRKLCLCNFEDLKHLKWARLVVLIASVAGLLFVRCYIMDFNTPSFQKGDNPASFIEEWWLRSLSLQYIACLNFWLLLCPDWLCFDWSMGCVPLIEHFSDVRALVPVGCLIALLLFVYSASMQRHHHRQRELLLCLSLMIMPFLPASNLLFRVGFVVAERVLYIPSAGFCLLIALGMEKIFTKKDVSFFFCLLMMVFVLKSHVRSLDWRSETSLFSAALHVCPDNAKVRYNVAKSAADRGDSQLAIKEYREAIRLFPEYDQALNNLANLLKSHGELLEAERLLRRALKIRHEFPAAWMNLGIVLAELKKYQEAEKCYLNALKLRKNYPDCYYNLGNLFLEQNRLVEAEKAWRTAIDLRPTMSMAWNNLIMLKDNHGNHSEAVELGTLALSAIGNEPSFFFNTANALGKLSRFPQAEDHFKKAILYDPHNALYHVNLGVLYHRWQKYHLAESSYLAAIKLNPKLNSAKQNYQLLMKKLKKL